ncbi:MAG: hypothetical protein F6J87_10135 [Spirulina sp. SIO3F2]|nr:hypothetical protein [Spirulina sp. SIO3F2]
MIIWAGLGIVLLLPACGGDSVPPTDSGSNADDATTAPALADPTVDSLPAAPETTASPIPQVPQSTPLTPEIRLGLTGFGPIQVGMTIEQAEAATGMTFKSESSGGEEYGCEYYRVEAFDGIALMVTDGTIARVELRKPNLATISGAKLGSTEAQIRNLYPGQIQAEPHEYIPNGKYLLYVPKDADSQDYRVIFEVDAQGNVVAIRSGQLPEVGYIEGCV